MFLQKLQPRIQETFPCSINNARSKIRPLSVHKLRPGDIDVIAAIGDSLTAAWGLTATNIFQIFVENRGLSFSIGKTKFTLSCSHLVSKTKK